MKSAKLSAIIYAVVLSLLLLIPTLMIRYVDHDARKDWENRNLSERPTITELRENPKQGFKDFDDYLNDHIGGSFQAIKFRRKFYFDHFGATGDTYIVGNDRDAYFLTSPFQSSGRENPFSWWNDLCITSQNKKHQDTYLKRFVRSEKYLSQRGATVVYGMVPTKPVLLQDQLPRSTPEEIKLACQSISKNNNLAIALTKTDPNLNIFYPYQAFKDRIDDPLFYPNAAYHWQGESTWIFTEEFAKTYSLDVPLEWDPGPCAPKDVKWDIGALIGVGQETAGCDRDLKRLGIVVDEQFPYLLKPEASKESVTVVKMTNPNATNDQTAIVFSNSFGPAVREQIASHFKTTYHLRGGIITGPDMRSLLEDSNILEADFIVVTIADFHYRGFLNYLEPNKTVLASEAQKERQAIKAERQAIKAAKREAREKARAEARAKKEAMLEKKRLAKERQQAARDKKRAAEEKKKNAIDGETEN